MNEPTTAEECYKKGLAALENKTYHEAVVQFQRAIDLGKDSASDLARSKCSSFFGLALTMAKGRSEEAVRLCEQAARINSIEPDLFCNLGVVYLRHGRRGPAFQNFYRALSIRPDHARTLQEIDKFEKRSFPVFTFLPRHLWLNRMLGKLRQRIRVLLHREEASEP